LLQPALLLLPLPGLCPSIFIPCLLLLEIAQCCNHCPCCYDKCC
jgi:hypothetical protein